MPFQQILKSGVNISTTKGPSPLLRYNVLLSVLLYCAGLHYAYVEWISPVWAYSGLTYKSPNPGLLTIAYALAGTLSVVSPFKLRRPSHVIYWVLYFTVYIPGLFVPLFLQLDNGQNLFLLQLGLTSGMLAIALSGRLSLLSFRRYPFNARAFWAIFSAVYLVGNMVLIAVYRNNFHFATIRDMYALRFEASSVVAENPAVGYVRQMLGNVLNPLLMAYGIANRRKPLVVLGIFGEMLLYASSPAKSSFVSFILIAVFYYTIKGDQGGWVPKAALFLAGICFGLTTLVIAVRPGILFNIATITLVRTLAIPGMVTGQYQYFFENQPHTYLSTVHLVDLVVPVSNPYSLPLGMEVGAFYGAKSSAERGMLNANANFFATDGIGGFGLMGIPMVGIFCALVLWVLDSCARGYPTEFSVAGLSMVMLSLGNVSIFTTLLGNGLLVWMLLFVVMPRSLMGTGLPLHGLRLRA